MRLSILRAPDLGPRALATGAVVDVAPLEAQRLLDLGQAVLTPGALVTVPGADFVHVGTVATLPAPSTVGAAFAAVTDLGQQGLTVLRSTGSVWRPVGPVMLGAFLSAAGQAVAAAAAETQLGTEFKLPAGLAQPGDLLRVIGLATNGAADANVRSLRARVDDEAGFTLTSGTLHTLFSTSNASNTAHQLDKVFHVLDATTLTGGGGGQTSASTSSTALASTTVPTLAADTFWKFSALPSSTQNWTVFHLALQLIPGS